MVMSNNAVLIQDKVIFPHKNYIVGGLCSAVLGDENRAGRSVAVQMPGIEGIDHRESFLALLKAQDQSMTLHNHNLDT